MHIKKGNNVKVIVSKDKDEEGKIIITEPKKDRIAAEGVNVIKKHQKPTQLDSEDRTLEIEATTHVSNVQLLDFKINESTCVGYKFVNDRKVRTTRKSGERVKSNN